MVLDPYRWGVGENLGVVKGRNIAWSHLGLGLGEDSFNWNSKPHPKAQLVISLLLIRSPFLSRMIFHSYGHCHIVVASSQSIPRLSSKAISLMAFNQSIYQSINK